MSNRNWYKKWNKKDLINRLLLTEAMNQALSDYIEENCEAVTYKEIEGRDYLRINDKYFLHPLDKHSIV